MKRILKSALLITLLTNLLTAETVFDLSQQHFSNSIDGDGVGARYDLPKVYVSTALRYLSGQYVLANNTVSQKMDVEIKQPLSDWSVSFDMIYGLDDIHPIRFTSDTGKSILVSFSWNAINLNGTRIYTNTSSLEGRTEIVGVLTKTENTVTLSVSGYITKSITVSNFSKLKFVSVSVISDYEYVDRLNGLNIGN